MNSKYTTKNQIGIEKKNLIGYQSIVKNSKSS